MSAGPGRAHCAERTRQLGRGPRECNGDVAIARCALGPGSMRSRNRTGRMPELGRSERHDSRARRPVLPRKVSVSAQTEHEASRE